jgi:hypothetical protein
MRNGEELLHKGQRIINLVSKVRRGTGQRKPKRQSRTGKPVSTLQPLKIYLSRVSRKLAPANGKRRH